MSKPKFILKSFKTIMIVAICVILGILFINPTLLGQITPNIFYSIMGPTYVRDSAFRKYTKGNQDIYFLGTTHSMSLTSKPFSYLELKAVIENLKPDLLLIESRPEQLANKNFADGPPEMLYSHLTAISNGISVKGVDWWTVNESLPNSTNTIRDNHINENILKSVVGYKKILILMGNAHLGIEQPKLENAGYKTSSFTNSEKDNLFKAKNNKLIYPKGMNYYIQKRISYEKNCIGTVYKTDMWKKQVLIVVEDLNNFSKIVKQIGESQ